MEIKTLNEQIERLKALVRKCYATVAGKNGTVPEVGERNMENLPNAIASTHDTLEELTITQNGEYTPQEGVDGFSKVTAEFDTSSLPKVKVTTLGTISNDCIDENGYWPAELVDTSMITNISSAFFRNANVKTLDVSNWNVSNVTNFSHMFRQCSNLFSLDVSNWDVSKGQKFVSMFYASAVRVLDLTKWELYNANEMTQFVGGGSQLSLCGGCDINQVITENIAVLKGLKVNTDIQYATNLDRASLRALINGLADLTGQTAQTLTLGRTLMAKLTEEDIAIATSKNWTIA